jgi:hypothetical protein
MFCPQCGSQPNDDLRFCKNCGANLLMVRQVISPGTVDEGFDWSKTWVAEMFLSDGERKRRKEELDRQRGITPEIMRYREIKAGVITSCVGVGVMTLLYFLMQGIILSGNIHQGDEAILSRIWIAGIIPVMVGVALIINGTIVGRKLAEIEQRGSGAPQGALEQNAEPRALKSADTNQFIPAGTSVTEDETQHLYGSRRN